ncbi:MAG: hypothetical protein HQK59_04305 [Deltaproteobacteria bacterium]|nr:hypothetical protein [Deltaproteobacteria bacterium]
MIVPMKKVTFVGIEKEKDRFIKRLQEIGVTHLINPPEPVEPADLAKELARVTEARVFLSKKGTAEKTEKKLNYKAIVTDRENFGQKESRLQTEVVALKKDLAVLTPWGDFNVDDLNILRDKGLHVQFFRISQKAFSSLPLKDIYYRVVAEHRGEICFVTASTLPIQLEMPEEKLPQRGLSELTQEIETKEADIKQIEQDYISLAKHLDTLIDAEAMLTNSLEYSRALMNTQLELSDRLFILKVWSPLPEAELMAKVGTTFTVHYYSEEPQVHETVPVLLKNPAVFDSGEDLVKVYSFPSYQDFDPSPLVLYCFSIFFGMIIGDAGYGLTMLAITFWLQKKVNSKSPFAVRFFRLTYILCFTTIAYGMMTVSYFGVALAPDNPLQKLLLVDMNSKEGQNQAMVLSILIGMTHISLSMLIKFKNTRDLASLGWVIVIWTGFFVTYNKMKHGVDVESARYGLMAGFFIVFLFSSNSKQVLFRILGGLNGMLGVVQVFSDVLSYLRLFALGIATVYMSQTFNMLAADIAKSVPYAGYVFAALILLAGHAVNLLLGIMGGVIHGLRLNFLEWYRWSFGGDGLPFKPFRQIKTRN